LKFVIGADSLQQQMSSTFQVCFVHRVSGLLGHLRDGKLVWLCALGVWMALGSVHACACI
jgi:hypothetical protein